MTHLGRLQRTLVCGFGLLLAGSGAWAEGAGWPLRRLSLREAIRLAQRRHVNVIVADERVQQALARLSQARSILLPQVTGTLSQARQTKNLEAAGITLPGRDPLVGPFKTFDARLKLTQTLFDAGAIQRLRAATAAQQLSLAEYDKARQDAIALVGTLYLEAQRASDGLEAAHALLMRDARRAQIANAQAELGMGTPLGFHEAEAALIESLHHWRAALAQATERQLDLAVALGLPSEQAIIFTSDAPLGDPPSGDMLGTHPDLEAARRLVRERRAERAAQVADSLPRATATADYGASGSTPSGSDTTYGAGVSVSMPIFEGGLRRARVQEAAGALRESEARLADTERRVDADTLRAAESVAQARMLVEAADTVLSVSTRSLALAEHRLDAGISSDVDVTEARAQAALAKDQRAEAIAAYQMAQIALARAAGHADRLCDLRGGL